MKTTWGDLEKKALRRDPAFRKRLARGLGMEQPPESFHLALERTYEELPDELVAKRYPMRTALLALRAAAAVLVIAAGAWFALEHFRPELVPGLPESQPSGLSLELPEASSLEKIVVEDGVSHLPKAFPADSQEFEDIYDRLSRFRYEEVFSRTGLAGYDLSVTLVSQQGEEWEYLLQTSSAEREQKIYQSVIPNVFPLSWRCSLTGRDAADPFQEGDAREGSPLPDVFEKELKEVSVWDAKYPGFPRELTEDEIGQLRARWQAFRYSELFDGKNREPQFLTVRLTYRDGSSRTLSLGELCVQLDQKEYYGGGNPICFSRAWLENVAYSSLSLETEEPSRLGESSAVPEPAGELPEKPAFSPAVFPGNEGWELTVSDAWSDGRYLHLDLMLRLPQGAVKSPAGGVQSFETDLRNGGADSCVLTVDGKAAARRDLIYEGFEFGQDGDGYSARWVYDLPEPLDRERTLQVKLEMPTLYGLEGQWDGEHFQYEYSEGGWPETYPMEAGLSAEFEVTAQPGCNARLAEPVTDNGTTLLEVDSTPSRLLMKMETPLRGYMGGTLMHSGSEAGLYDKVPLGVYAYVRREDGLYESSVFRYLYNADGVQGLSDPFTKGLEKDGTGWVEFPALDWGQREVVVQLFEYPARGKGGASNGLELSGEMKNRVTAEFTFDLATGQARPSENYKKDGWERLDGTAAEPRRAEPVNGYYPVGTNAAFFLDGNVFTELTFYTEDLDYRPVEVRCYYEEDDTEPVRTVYSHLPEEYNGDSEYYAVGGDPVKCYVDESGVYREDVTDKKYTEKEFRRLCFLIQYPEELEDAWGLVRGFARMELVDSGTGQVLIEDVDQASRKAYSQVFGVYPEDGAGP